MDGGKKWFKCSSGLPNIPVRDLAIQKRENDLVAATFGRGFYVLDDYSALRELSTERLDKESHLFPVRRTWWYAPVDRLGGMGSREGFQGDSYFVADNPTYGAVFTVHLKEAFKSLKETRAEAEQNAKKENKDAKVASLADLEKEAEELVPMRFIRISDAAGAFVARVPLPTDKGLHRVSWDLKKAPLRGTGLRPMALPGNYTAIVMLWDGKDTKAISEPVPFSVEPMVEPSMPPVDRQQALEFQNQVVALQHRLERSIKKLERGIAQLEEAEKVAKDGAPELGSVWTEIRQAALDGKKLEKQLQGNAILQERYIESVPSPAERLSSVLFGMMSSTHGPTKTHRDQFEICKVEIDAAAPRIDALVDQTITAICQKLIAMGYDLQVP